MRNFKTIHYLIAAVCFLTAFIVYFITMQPSVPFWDCGEFAAAASALQVPHPPGAPLWTLIGRIAIMLPIQGDFVARYNLFSVLFSSATILFLYLITVRLITMWRGMPISVADAVTTLGGGLIAALTFIFTDSFWFNAVECEVYGFTMFFISLLLWLTLVWYDYADTPHNEKLLLLISYVMGVGLGAHQIIVLTIFTLLFLIYYRREKSVTTISWLKLSAAALLGFVIIYKIILVKLVAWLATVPFLSIAFIIAVIVGIWFSNKQHKPLLNISLWSILFIMIGYSTYVMIFIRSNQHLPMNLNAPSTLTQFNHYLGRDQYGDRGFWPRRSLDEFGQKTGPTWDSRKYTSDMNFMWNYQIDHMSNRYLYWNFIGRSDDRQDANTDWSKTWGIPFFFGLFGFFWHFKRDPKRAFSILLMFLTLGIVSALFQNTQDPTERERDYFYVGSYFIFAIWVGIGATGLMEIFRSKKTPASNDEVENHESAATHIPRGNIGSPGLTGALCAVCIIAIPINLCVGLGGLVSGKSFAQSSKWAEYSRAGDYVPFDCAYNILQSCDKDAILFTNGDNDSFPLWCLQDVYGIRRDVRIVVLGFANVGWYINQLKNEEPWGAKKILLEDKQFTSEKLSAIATSDDPFALKAETAFPQQVSIALTAQTVSAITDEMVVDPIPLAWKYIGSYDSGNKFVFTTADQVAFDIVKSNINSRPIYFSVTVPENRRIGLDNNMAAEGLALRVTPIPHAKDNSGYGGGVNERRLNAFLFHHTAEAKSAAVRENMIRSFNDPSANISYIDKNFAFNYLMAYMRYADWMLDKGETTIANSTLQEMERVLPSDRVASDVYPADIIAELFDKCGNKAKTKQYAVIAMTVLSGNELLTAQQQYRLGNLNLLIGNIEESQRIYSEIQQNATDESVKFQMKLRLMEVEGRKLEANGDRAAALALYEQILILRNLPDQELPADFKPLLRHRNALRKQLTS